MSIDAHVRRRPSPAPAFRHEAFFYAEESELLAGLTSFVRDGVAAGEPTLAVSSAPKIERLKERLGADAGAVRFANMDEVGLNPARIIPAWRDFVSEHGNGTRLRGIGEPISADRNPPELVECHRHEALLNLAFADGPDFWLLCPYDTAALAPAALDGARRNHPFLCRLHLAQFGLRQPGACERMARRSPPRASEGGPRAGVRRRPARVRPSARIGVRGAGRHEPGPDGGHRARRSRGGDEQPALRRGARQVCASGTTSGR
jgi:MEDS: MEthanogen/methylotroph, DcmR Sensory domain